MTLDDIMDKIDKKLEKIENDMDEDEIPPWFGKKEKQETTDDTNKRPDYTKVESDTETTIELLLPDNVNEDQFSIDLEDNVLDIQIENLDVNYEYELSESESDEDIDAKYHTDKNKLEINIGKK